MRQQSRTSQHAAIDIPEGVPMVTLGANEDRFETNEFKEELEDVQYRYRFIFGLDWSYLDLNSLSLRLICQLLGNVFFQVEV